MWRGILCYTAHAEHSIGGQPRWCAPLKNCAVLLETPAGGDARPLSAVHEETHEHARACPAQDYA